MFSFSLWPTLRALLLAAALTVVSLPVIFALHSHLELGAPPANGLRALALGAMLAFIGATWIGHGLGRIRGGRTSGTVAALSGFIWGTLLAVALSSYYGGLVAHSALRDSNALAGQNHDRVAQNPAESIEQARAGHASRDAALAGMEFSDDAHNVTIQSASKLPAMPLLIWVILIPPALSIFECHRTRHTN